MARILHYIHIPILLLASLSMASPADAAQVATPPIAPPPCGPADTVQQFIACESYILLDSTHILLRDQNGCDSLWINYTTELGDCVSCGDQCIYITGTTSISGGETTGAEVIVTYALNGDTLSSGRGDWTGEVDQLACFPAEDMLEIIAVEAYVPSGASGTASASAWIVRNPGAAEDTTFVNGFTCLPSEVGIQVDTLHSSSGCDSIVVRELSLYPLPEVFVANEAACAGDTVVLLASATSEGLYQWNTGQRGETLIATSSGEYTVNFTDSNGCTTNATAQVLLSQIEIELQPSIAGPLWLNEDPLHVWQGAAVELEAQVTGTGPDYDILWNGGPEVGDTIFNFVATHSDTIRVGVIDANGCFAQTSLPYTVREPNFFIPSAFSPNGDDINDHFGLYTSPNVEELRIQIFQRTGGMLLDLQPVPEISGEDARYWPVWDGSYNDQQLNPQTFVWQIRYRLFRGEWQTIAGEVSLIR